MIVIEKGSLSSFSFSYLTGLGKHFVIITDTHVEALYGNRLKKRMDEAGLTPVMVTIPPGEGSKSRAQKEWIEDRMGEAKVSRDGVVIALGGGVITDLAGFVAATYCRGIPYVSIPTTLLAMVDACGGGKVAVNTPWGKNQIGSFHSPSLVLIDPETLHTLPAKELLNGKAEIFKYGLIATPDVLQGEIDGGMIERCLRTKMEIVSQDPYEKGMRRVLNFGHTLGHAFESSSQYRVSHGEAVAWGMALEAKLSAKMALLQKSDAEWISSQLLARGFSLQFPFVKKEEILRHLVHDKKASGGQTRFVLLEKIGKVDAAEGMYCRPVPLKIVEEVLEEHGLA